MAGWRVRLLREAGHVLDTTRLSAHGCVGFEGTHAMSARHFTQVQRERTIPQSQKESAA